VKKIHSIQRQTSIIIAIFIRLEEIRQTNSFAISTDFHKIFYQLKLSYPKYFERLMFDTNGDTPISDNIKSIFGTFNVCGIRTWTDNKVFINLEHYTLEKICEDLSVNELKITKIAHQMNLLIEQEEV